MQTASHAQQYLLDYTLAEIKSIVFENDLDFQTLFFGNLCARGDSKKIKVFLRETIPSRMKEILNTRHHLQWYGTCLHQLLFWNKGIRAIELFSLLVEHGALFYQNIYSEFPWEQKGDLWISCIDSEMIGGRYIEEFEETYDFIQSTYQEYDAEDYDAEEDDMNKKQVNEFTFEELKQMVIA